MNKYLLALIVVTICGFNSVFAGSLTGHIKNIHYISKTGGMYSNTMKIALCGGDRYIKSDTEERKNMLAILLSARASGEIVTIVSADNVNIDEVWLGGASGNTSCD
jgi:hypothetical protein